MSILLAAGGPAWAPASYQVKEPGPVDETPRPPEFVSGLGLSITYRHAQEIVRRMNLPEELAHKLVRRVVIDEVTS